MTDGIFKRIAFIVDVILCSFMAYILLHTIDGSYKITPFKEWDTYFGDGIWFHSSHFWIGVLTTILLYVLFYAIMGRFIRRHINNRINKMKDKIEKLKGENPPTDIQKVVGKISNTIICLFELNKNDKINSIKSANTELLAAEILWLFQLLTIFIYFHLMKVVIIIGLIVLMSIIVIQYITIPAISFSNEIFTKIFNEKVSQKG